MTEQYRTHADKVVDSLAANPSDDVIADESRTLVGSELLDLITRLSHALAAQGVSRGNTVAILAPIAIEAIAIRYAATRLGCVTVLAIGPIPGVPTDLLALARDASTASLRIDVDESDPCVLVATGLEGKRSQCRCVRPAGRPRADARSPATDLHAAALHRPDSRRHRSDRRRSTGAASHIRARDDREHDRREAGHAPRPGRAAARRTPRRDRHREPRPVVAHRDQSYRCRRLTGPPSPTSRPGRAQLSRSSLRCK